MTKDLELGRRAVLGGVATASASLASSALSANTLRPKPLSGRANPNGRFAGKCVLITGATSGIGKTTAQAFAREGAKVVFCGRREALGHEVEAGIRALGGEATYRRADVRRHDDVNALVHACVQRYGRVDIAFNNAGIFMTPADLQDIEVDNYLDIMATNAAGTFFAMKYELPVMRRQGDGVIINMA